VTDADDARDQLLRSLLVERFTPTPARLAQLEGQRRRREAAREAQPGVRYLDGRNPARLRIVPDTDLTA
jgi:hypothetical protein